MLQSGQKCTNMKNGSFFGPNGPKMASAALPPIRKSFFKTFFPFRLIMTKMEANKTLTTGILNIDLYPLPLIDGALTVL